MHVLTFSVTICQSISLQLINAEPELNTTFWKCPVASDVFTQETNVYPST